MTTKIKHEELRSLLNSPPPDFETYVRPLLNLANRYAHGTRPAVVGQMCDLIQEFSGKTLDEWERWYRKKHPDTIDQATTRILKKLRELREVLDRIDENTVRRWVEDLVIEKTFFGLKFQEAILKKGAELCATSFRHADPDDEAKGIDGYIGETPISIKASTYKLKENLQEEITIPIVYYTKDKDGIQVHFSNVIKSQD